MPRTAKGQNETECQKNRLDLYVQLGVFFAYLSGDAKGKIDQRLTSPEQRAILSLLRLLSHGSNIGGGLGIRLAVWASGARRVRLGERVPHYPLSVPPDAQKR